MSSEVEARKARAESACATAEQFITLYYERMDTKRHVLSKLYLDTATASWNGHSLKGKGTAMGLAIDVRRMRH